MNNRGLVCPECRTWFEPRGRRPRCPSCGRRVDEKARPLATTTGLPQSDSAGDGPAGVPRPAAPAVAIKPFDFWDGLGVALFLGAGLLLVWVGLASGSAVSLGVAAALLASGGFTLYAMSNRNATTETQRFFAGIPRFALTAIGVLTLLLFEFAGSCA
jgi:hypothetical protein